MTGIRPRYYAALPWYLFAQTRAALDAVWGAVATELHACGFNHCPDHLDHGIPHEELLTIPTLVLGQCCGPDLFLEQAKHIKPVAAPVIAAYNVSKGHYFSYIVRGREGRLDKPNVVVNSLTSHSGKTALELWLRKSGVEDYSLYLSGSHARSVLDLQSGRADVAAIDALSWQFLDTTGLEILDQSEPVWAPPFITGRDSHVPDDLLVAALNSALERFGEPVGITGALPVTRGAYSKLRFWGMKGCVQSKSY